MTAPNATPVSAPSEETRPPSCLADAALLLRKSDRDIATQLDALIRSWPSRSPGDDTGGATPLAVEVAEAALAFCPHVRTIASPGGVVTGDRLESALRRYAAATGRAYGLPAPASCSSAPAATGPRAEKALLVAHQMLRGLNAPEGRAEEIAHALLAGAAAADREQARLAGDVAIEAAAPAPAAPATETRPDCVCDPAISDDDDLSCTCCGAAKGEPCRHTGRRAASPARTEEG